MRVRPIGRGFLALAVLAGLTVGGGAHGAPAGATHTNSARHAALAAPTEGPYGGTAAAVPGTVQAANYDTGGQGVAYNTAAGNGSANSYRSDGIDLETTADTQDTGAGGRNDDGG